MAMVEISARVVAVEADQAWVAVEAPASCGACHGKGCGRSVFARIWHPEGPRYALPNTLAASVGDAVVLQIREGALLQAAWWGYGWPLLSVLVLAAAFQPWGEGAAVVGAGLGLGIGWLVNRRLRFVARPTMLRRGVAASCTQE